MKLRFSIRDLLWLTLVVAICVGWCTSYLKSRSERAAISGAVLTVHDLRPRSWHPSSTEEMKEDILAGGGPWATYDKIDPREFEPRLQAWIKYQHIVLDKLHELREHAE